MAKISNGICDNLLVSFVQNLNLKSLQTCILRAWDLTDKEKNVYLAPAMNTAMWQHVITAEQIERLNEFGYNLIMPIEKKLACGDLGMKN